MTGYRIELYCSFSNINSHAQKNNSLDIHMQEKFVPVRLSGVEMFLLYE
jgi:hypothetical protein